METQHTEERSNDSRPHEPDPIMPDLGSLHGDAARFLEDAGRAIDNALSGDSQAFLRDVRQHGAQ
jgi:hypothetical protein